MHRVFVEGVSPRAEAPMAIDPKKLDDLFLDSLKDR